MIEGREITRVYGKQKVLTKVNIELKEGEALLLLGDNGSGKSTLLDILALAARPDSGGVFIDGEDAFKSPKDFRQQIAYVPQDIALFEELTVKENLECWSRLSKSDTEKRIEKLDPVLRLKEMYGKKIVKLSGGMKRRVNLAVALLGNYKYMILDEPLAGVDVDTAERIISMLDENRKAGVGIAVSAHDSNQLLRFADRTVTMVGGE